MRKYYGQFNPPNDWLIERFFPKGYVGYCVEVGAADGVNCSNTLYFEELGWNCLCIEPNPAYREKLIAKRRLSISCAVSNRNEDGVLLHRFRIGDTFEAVTSLTVDKRLLNEHLAMISQTDQVPVDVRTLDACLEATGWTQLDFVTIDTEGTELSVLEGFELNRWNPKVVVVENNYETPEIERHMRVNGYAKVLRHEVNDFFFRML